MEVLVQDVKPETIVPDLEGHHHHQHLNLNNNNNNQRKITLLSAGTTLSSSNPTTLINSSYSNNNKNIVNSSTPVRTTTLSGHQLQTMAKSSGLSIVHVTLPQVADRSKIQHIIRSSRCIEQKMKGIM